MHFIDAPSPYFNDRPEGVTPSLIVLHFTGGESFEDSLEKLTQGKNGREVSAHYLIREDGVVFRLVPEEKRAWHAGRGDWNNSGDVNNLSIGIELSNRDRKPYTEAQLRALTELVHGIQKRHGIPPENVIGHSDLAPGRKDDPGYHFPWARLAKEGIGVMPEVKLRDTFRAAATAKNPRRLQKLLTRAGYTAEDTSLRQFISAFQQHHTPDIFTAPRAGETPGDATARMVAQLRAAARHNRRHRPKR